MLERLRASITSPFPSPSLPFFFPFSSLPLFLTILVPRLGWHGGTYVNGIYRHGFMLEPSLARIGFFFFFSFFPFFLSFPSFL